MSFDYSKSKQLADRLIAAFGVELTYTRQTDADFDPATGTVTASEETFSANTVWLSYEEDQIDGTLVQQGDARILVSGTPIVGDIVTQDGEDWRIISTSPLEPAATLIYTEAQVRR